MWQTRLIIIVNLNTCCALFNSDFLQNGSVAPGTCCAFYCGGSVHRFSAQQGHASAQQSTRYPHSLTHSCCTGNASAGNKSAVALLQLHTVHRSLSPCMHCTRLQAVPVILCGCRHVFTAIALRKGAGYPFGRANLQPHLQQVIFVRALTCDS